MQNLKGRSHPELKGEWTPLDILNRVEGLALTSLSNITHSGNGFKSHLLGTYEILVRWGLPISVCHAGLLHSIYGTEIFKVQGLPLKNRPQVSELVGSKAERLAYLFCAMDRLSLYFNQIDLGKFAIYDRYAGCLTQIAKQDFNNLLHIAAANILEQTPRLDKIGLGPGLASCAGEISELLEFQQFLKPDSSKMLKDCLRQMNDSEI